MFIQSGKLSVCHQHSSPAFMSPAFTLIIQKDSPGKENETNWLPAPDGPVYMLLRLYWPKTTQPSILAPGKGTWQPPPVAAVS
jgi:hypothetical protein